MGEVREFSEEALVLEKSMGASLGVVEHGIKWRVGHTAVRMAEAYPPRLHGVWSHFEDDRNGGGRGIEGDWYIA